MRIVYIDEDGNAVWGLGGLLDYDKFCWAFKISRAMDNIVSFLI